MEALSPLALGFLGSLGARLMAAFGAVLVLFGRLPSQATRDLSLGFAAGVMLAASFFSLIIPALDAAEPMFANEAALSASRSALAWGLAFAAGAMLYVIGDEIIPETHRNGHKTKQRLAW